jgi:hypothetical protein
VSTPVGVVGNMYNRELGAQILLELAESFPTTMTIAQMQAGLPRFSALPEEDWIAAVDALNQEGLVGGTINRASSRVIEIVGPLTITYRGRRKIELGHSQVAEARKAALVADIESKVFQHNNSMELDLALTDDSVFELVMLERNRELAELEVEIAEARKASAERHAVASVIAESRLAELRGLTPTQFDFRKLIRLCEELNTAYAGRCYFATAMLVRGILDHVPPIFRQRSFKEVANNYGGGGTSFKESMLHLQNAARNIADAHLHMPIRKSETLPAMQQVNFGSQLDVLLSEIIRISQRMEP